MSYKFILMMCVCILSGCAVSSSFLIDGSETVPHQDSCWVRNGFNDRENDNGGYCQPTKFDI